MDVAGARSAEKASRTIVIALMSHEGQVKKADARETNERTKGEYS
jgi:hypothetical protein